MPDAARDALCRDTAAALRAIDASAIKALVGFDGFVDTLLQAVDRRYDADRFEPVHTIAALGSRISASAGHSANLELVRKQQKLGGNGPIMANALASLGFGVTYIGNLGYPTPHPVFADFARVATVHTIANPGLTDALEFDDGKLMLTKNETLADVNWQNVVDRVGLPTLRTAFDSAGLIGLANWTMLTHLTEVWRHLLSEVFPHLSKPARRRIIFVDLADPAKRTEADLLDALTLLGEFQNYADVVLGLNANEGRRVAELLGLGTFENNRPMAKAVREKLGVTAIVVHTRHGAAGVTADDVQSVQGPFVRKPLITTGAGDHFNAGFSFALSLGLPLAGCLCCGVAVGGYYVSRGASPTLPQLIEFIERLPDPEADL